MSFVEDDLRVPRAQARYLGHKRGVKRLEPGGLSHCDLARVRLMAVMVKRLAIERRRRAQLGRRRAWIERRSRRIAVHNR